MATEDDRPRILIVEDNTDLQTLLKEVLSINYTVAAASSGEEAIAIARTFKPDLVLLDLVMSGMDGLEVLTRLRELDKDARIIVATADIQISTQEIVKAAGALDFVTKPFTSEPLLKAVNKGLSSSEGRAQ